MKLLSLKFNNLFSYEDGEMSLSNLDCALFKGKNGAGKSSIFDIICWSLYGVTARKKYKNILRNSPDKPKSGIGIIEFISDDGLVYKIERSTGNKNFTKVYKNGELLKFRTATIVQNEIDNIIGIDYKTFLNTAYYSQGDVGKFLTSESAERIKIITDMLTELGDIDLIKKKVDDDVKKISYETENLKGQLLVHKELTIGIDVLEIKKQIKNNNSAIDEKLKKLVDYTALMDRMNQKNSIIDGIKKYEYSQKEYEEDLEIEVQQLNAQIEIIEKKNSDKPKIIAELKRTEQALQAYTNLRQDTDIVISHISRVESENDKLRTTIEINNKEIFSLQKVLSMKDSACPVCKSIITSSNIDNLNQLIASRQQDSELNNITITKNLEVLKKLYLERKNYQDEAGKMNQLSAAKADLKNKIEKSKYYNEEIGRIKELIQQKIDKSIDKRNQVALKLTELNLQLKKLKGVDLSKCDEIEARRSKLDGEIQHLQDENRIKQIKVDNYYVSIKKITAIEKELEKYGSDEQIISFWSKALPKIKVEMISGVIPFLESETNKYLSQILPGKILKFVADSDKSNNKLDVTILDVENDVERIYEGWSGGEKSKMAISVYIALNKLASLRSGKSIDFIILDEKFSSIDYESRVTLMDMLKNEYKGRKIWAISHVDTLDSEFNQIVEIKKINGISKVCI